MKNSSFSNKLKSLLTVKKMNGADLSRLLEMKPQQVSRYLNGTTPDLETIQKMSARLGVPVSDLLPDTQKSTDGLRLEAISLLLSASQEAIERCIEILKNHS